MRRWGFQKRKIEGGGRSDEAEGRKRRGRPWISRSSGRRRECRRSKRGNDSITIATRRLLGKPREAFQQSRQRHSQHALNSAAVERRFLTKSGLILQHKIVGGRAWIEPDSSQR